MTDLVHSIRDAVQRARAEDSTPYKLEVSPTVWMDLRVAYAVDNAWSDHPTFDGVLVVCRTFGEGDPNWILCSKTRGQCYDTV